MTKKDYVKFARMIRSQRHALANSPKWTNQDVTIGEEEKFLAGGAKMLDILVDEMCIIFQGENPQFNTDVFIENCQIEDSDNDTK